MTHAILIESVQSHFILYRVSQDHGTPPFFSLFLKIHFWNFAHLIYLVNATFWHINLFLFISSFTGSDANFWFSYGTPCIFLHFWIPYKRPSIMTYQLSIFDYLFRNYKHLNTDILAILTGICAKTVRGKAKWISLSYISFL